MWFSGQEAGAEPLQLKRAGTSDDESKTAGNARKLTVRVTITFLISAALLVYGSGRGLDLTDEIFYLVWTRDPHAYALTYQPFGYLLHPLYVLVGGNLQNYRLAGFVITAAAGAFVGWSLADAKSRRTLFALYGAQAALTIFFPWIITPSYNSAANVGALLIIGGLLNAFEGSGRVRASGSLATAAGLCIAAFSKPPLFALASVGIAFGAFLERRARLALVLSLVLGSAAITLFIPVAEIPRLVQRIMATQHILALPNTPVALPGKVIRDWLVVPLPLTAAALAAAASFVLRRFSVGSWLGYAAVALSLYYVTTIVPDAIEGSIPDFLGLSVVTIAAGYASVLDHEHHAMGVAVGLLLVAPVLVALGTFNNQWFQLNFSMAFPFLMVFATASSDILAWRRRAALTFALVGPLAVILLASWVPYSLPAPIYQQQFPTKPPLARGTILVDEQTADFARDTRGLAEGALLIDLSGTGPGVGALLGAHEPVLSWLNPATPTWPDVVWSRLSPGQRQMAWFIVPIWPQFTRSQPATWLMNHKAAFCRMSLPQMFFWGEDRTLELWRPCGIRDRSAVNAARAPHEQP